MKKEESNFNTYLIIGVVIVIAIGLYFMIRVPTEKEQPIETKEVIVTLLGTDCEDCFNASMAVDFVKRQKTLNVKEVKELSISDSKETAEKYNITKLPAVIITGELENITMANFEKKQDALVFENSPPPYYDIESGKIVGKVEAIILADPSCKECLDMDLAVSQLEQIGVKISKKTNIDATSEEGKELITKYKIEKIPTAIFNKEALEYEPIGQVWDQIGTQEKDGSLVLRAVTPPYINISTGKTEGLVGLMMLYDESCAECFNTTILKELFTNNMNMQFKTEELIDVSTTKGKLVLKKYNIELVPTIVLSKDVATYPGFAEAWKEVGTEEKDGMFVFRNIPLLENLFAQREEPFVYKNATSGELIFSSEEAEIAPPEPEE